jgi:hypothetical protein
MNVTETNMAICEALGLDPKRIRRDGVTIHLDSDLGPVISVEYHTLACDLDLLLTGLKQYKLVPLDDDDLEK